MITIKKRNQYRTLEITDPGGITLEQGQGTDILIRNRFGKILVPKDKLRDWVEDPANNRVLLSFKDEACCRMVYAEAEVELRPEADRAEILKRVAEESRVHAYKGASNEAAEWMVPPVARAQPAQCGKCYTYYQHGLGRPCATGCTAP